MFDETDTTDEKIPSYLMRALCIVSEPSLAESWSQALAAQRIEPVQVLNAIDAIRLATRCGFDLIVIAGDRGPVAAREFLSLIHRGLFGDPWPPVIVQLQAVQDLLAAPEGFAGCVVMNGSRSLDAELAINQAFASNERARISRGDHDA